MDILIVEDEFLAVQKLTKLLHSSPHPVHVAGVTDGIESTVAWLNANPQPDLILMDIELADGQSFEIFNRVSVTCPVVFTTSYDESAIKSFQNTNLNYLLKPIKKNELEQALASFRQTSPGKLVPSSEVNSGVGDLAKSSHQDTGKRQFMVRHDQRLVSVDTALIAYFYATDTGTYLCRHDKVNYRIDYRLDDLEKQLDPTYFFRVNDQVIVGANAITQVSPLDNRCTVELSPATEHEVEVSRERTIEFTRWLSR